MFGSNIVAFFTVQGFFIGVIFGILNSNNAGALLIDIFFITIFFYLFAHVVVSFYFRTQSSKMNHFSKKILELDLDKFIREINKREQKIDAISADTTNIASIKETG